MAMEREKEREMELESAMYTNCLLLGLDPSVIGIGVLNGIPRVGLFRHSNPKLGDQLLYYLISAIRGPAQSAKDFDSIWPIFDARQSKDFRKVVLGIISDLEEQGVIPKCTARVSALANCCGIRFVDLLWQLSVHALREVHRRTLVSDVAVNPLRSLLTDQDISHASALLPVLKARIALERQRFLNNVESTVRSQAKWSAMAHQMTAEFRSLSAEEAYLQLELENMQHMLHGAQPDIHIDSSYGCQMVGKATHMWDSILSHKNQYEVLSSGPIEDLIAHREHRYRISGASLLAAVDQSSQALAPTVLSSKSIEDYVVPNDTNIEDEPHPIKNWVKGLHSSLPPRNYRKSLQTKDKSKRIAPVVDIPEVFRRWTHALEGIQRQAHILANANNREGPKLLQPLCYHNRGDHLTLLSATCADHEQHFNNFEVLIHHLTDLNSEIHKSVRECTDQVQTVTSTLYPLARSSCGLVSSMHGASSEISDNEVAEATPRLSLGKVSPNPHTLELPKLFSLISTAAKGEDNFSHRKLKISVREAALSRQLGKVGSSRGSQYECGSERSLTPHSVVRCSQLAREHRATEINSQHLFESQFISSLVDKHDESEPVFDVNTLQDFDNFNELHEDDSPNGGASSSLKSFSIIEEPLYEVFSPTLLIDSPLLDDLYEDLLAPLSDSETAMMEH